MQPIKNLLVINTGSSSIKFVVFESADNLVEKVRFSLEGIGQKQGRLNTITSTGTKSSRYISCQTHLRAFDEIILELPKYINDQDIYTVGHRIVFGGSYYDAVAKVTPELLADLAKNNVFDPQHNPHALDIIGESAKHFAGIPQFACFDGAFFRDLPDQAKVLPLPKSLNAEGIQKHGYHGLSYEYLLSQIGQRDEKLASGKLVLAHLGSGASLASVNSGRPVDTTMSFSPASGIPMSNRSGDIDPAIPYYLMGVKNFTADQYKDIVNHKSGLLGISGLSSDMYTLLQSESDNPSAALAVKKFCYEVTKSIGTLSASLGGIDGLIFSGGIGERSSIIRSRVCENLSYLGLFLDESQNDAGQELISRQDSKPIYSLKTNEEMIIASKIKTNLGKS